MTPWNLPSVECNTCSRYEDSGDEQAPLTDLLKDMRTDGWLIESALQVYCPSCAKHLTKPSEAIE